jgi:hypothetical protein
MTIEQIQAELDRLLPMVLAKWIAEPKLEYRVQAAEQPSVQLIWYVGNTFNCKSWPDFPAFIAWLDALPSPEVAALRAHNDRLADVIDKARDAGIDDEYVTPLVVVRAAISTNLLGAA